MFPEDPKLKAWLWFELIDFLMNLGDRIKI